MSYGVHVTFETTEGNPPWMEAHDIVRIHDENDDLPKSNFISSQFKEAQAIVNTKVPCASCKTANDSDAKHCKKCAKAMPATNKSFRVELKNLYWSGNHASDSLASVAPFVHGRLEAIFVGEDGSVFGGAIIEDGKYTKCDVEMKLVPSGK
jgi:ribosomal protein L40E